MFRKNGLPQQPSLLGTTVSDLSETKRLRLEASWAESFRQEVLLRLDEKPFAVLYSKEGSRPNTPVNVLVGWETLKSGFGASDEEMYERYLFDVQVRYALGLEDLNAGDFALRTVYNFRKRLWAHAQGNSENLLEQAFEQVTDEQLAAFQVNSSQLRCDTTQIASDMANMSRLQLLVEVLQQVHGTLSPADQARYDASFAPYIKGKSQQFIYQLKRDDYKPALERVGLVMEQLVVDLAPDYAQESAYQMLCRVLDEHFVHPDNAEAAANLRSDEEPDAGGPDDNEPDDGELEVGLQVKAAKDLCADSVQSPHDPEATYRHKAGKDYRGYVANITETCDPENEVDLIVKVQTAPNNADDADLLRQALPNLIERTDVELIHGDGGFHSPELDKALADAEIEQQLTAIRGNRPDPEQIGLAQFQIESDEENNPLLLLCPQEQEIPVEAGRTPDRFIARPDREQCESCPLFQLCAVRPASAGSTPVLYFTRQQLNVALKRQLIAQQREGPNLRAAVEATVRSVKHPLPHGKAPVRGRFRVSCIILASALMVNVRRLHRLGVRKPRRSGSHIKRLRPLALISALFPLQRALWNPISCFSRLVDRFRMFSHPPSPMTAHTISTP